uniref:Amino acid permease/ SLC12A domain-containing protein n=1 Tax=Meloidogyne javanica TaxID=6303 RepID=A0A915MV38_MELJA
MGPHFKYLIALLVCIVLIGSINASLFGGSRFLWASARERHLPAFFSCINREHDSPRAALFVHVVLAMFLSFLGNLEEMISSYVAFFYSFVNYKIRYYREYGLDSSHN